jgi:hypothetical protein
LVAFKGEPAPDTLIGGIKGSGTGQIWGLKNDPAVFPSTTDFVLFLVTEEQYNANKNDLSVLKNAPFTRIYAYFNKSGTNEIIYPISTTLGGQYRITLNNLNTGYNVELRLNSPDGETLGYAGAETVNTTFYVDEGDYYIFPVFRKFSASLGEIVSVFPRNNSGNLILLTRAMGPLPDGTPEYTIQASTFSSGVVFKTGRAYLSVYNNNPNVAVYFKMGGTVQRTSTGKALINPGAFRMFEIPMQKLGSGHNTSFAESSLVGANVYEVGSDAAVGANLPAFTFYGDRYYEVHVTGTDLYDLSLVTNDNAVVDPAVTDYATINPSYKIIQYKGLVDFNSVN